MKKRFCKKFTLTASFFVLAFVILGVGLVYATASESNHKYTTKDGKRSFSLYTPSITSENVDDSEYEVNSNGETYGPGYKEAILGVAPDLIEARGVDGTLGYVRSEDIEPEEAKNPEEAMEMMTREKDNHVKIVPLYKEDGKTIIGEFKVGTVNIEDIIEIEEK